MPKKRTYTKTAKWFRSRGKKLSKSKAYKKAKKKYKF